MGVARGPRSALSVGRLPYIGRSCVDEATAKEAVRPRTHASGLCLATWLLGLAARLYFMSNILLCTRLRLGACSCCKWQIHYYHALIHNLKISTFAEVWTTERSSIPRWGALVKPRCTDGQPTTSSHKR